MSAHPPIPPAIAEKIASAALRVWEYVAYDALQSLADEQGKRIENVTMSREEVLELVTDAGRLQEKMQSMFGAADPAVEFVSQMYDIKGRADAIWAFLVTVFKARRYGM